MPAKKKRVVFTFDEDPDYEVSLAGSFNSWKPEPMKYNDVEKHFIKAKLLTPGRHEYKFVVNGTWVIDDKNEEFDYNDHGSMNNFIVLPENDS